MRIRLVVATVVVAAGLLGVSVPRVSADPTLTLTAPASANLGSGAPGTTISAAIGPVTVADDRALASASWTVTAAETDFANGAQTIPATDASYAPGSITTTGTITVTPTNLTLANSAENAVTGTAGVGDNTATWDPTVAVAVPASAVAGTYTGTLTQSVNGTGPSVTVTFTVTSGALSLSSPVSANLGSGAPGTTIRGAIGPVTVTDDRALLSASWTVAAAETDFANGAQTIPATDASYAPGSITTTGTITVIATNLTLANSAENAVTGTSGVGDNTASWDPTVAVAVPADAVAGTYTGTLTHSINGTGPSVTLTFTVVRPSITTSQQPATATAGNSIADKATVSGGDNPTGMVTFNLYDNPNGTGIPLFTDTEPLSGGVATSAGYTATAAGTDYWVATYNGDSNNGIATSGPADEPVTISPAAATHLTVSAPASVTAGSPFNVSVSAEDQFNNIATTYQGTVHFTTTDAGSGVVLPADYTFTSGDNGTHTFTNLVTLVTAGSQTVTVTDTTSSVTGSETITVTAATPTITTSQQPATATAGSSIADKATVSGGDNPTGTVTFNLYDNPNGTGIPLFTDTEPLSGGVATSAGYTATAAGTDYWVATYNGDSSNSAVTSGTALEPVTITAVIAPPSMAKAFTPASVQLNGTSTLTFSITNPNGTTALTGVAFTDALPSGLVVSSPNGLTDSCGGTASASAGGATISLTGASVAASATCTVAVSVTGTTAGTFTNTTGAVSSANGGTGGTATAVLTVATPVPTPPGPTTTTTAAPAPLPPFPHANVSYPNGAIVTFGANHYVFAGGRAFPASAAELAAVQKVDPAQVLAAPAGASAPTAVAPRMGLTVSTHPVDGNATIYVVGPDGQLHPFATPGQFLGDGYNRALVITVPDLGGLRVGDHAGTALTALATRADGAIVNSSGTFYTFAGGRAFGIPTPAALVQVRKTNAAVELPGPVPSAATGAPIANGVVLSVAGPVYVSYGGQLYPFKTKAQLATSGYGGTPAVPAPHTGGLTVVFPYSGS